MELVTQVCECGCAMDVLGLPDWVDQPSAEVLELRPPARLHLAA